MQPSLGLQVSLASQLPTLQAQSASTLPVKVSVHNTGNDPVTFLRWGTPFDPRAAVSGVFEVRDTTDGRVLPLDDLKMARKMPPSHEDLMEIPGGESLDKVVEIPGLDLQEGHDYSIVSKGIWHALWTTPMVSVTEDHLADLSSATRGEFRSNEAHVKAE
ncbi:Uncharacterized protein PECH_007376 [Penicillium ucsense]|uniref:Uncharacterized protein n=1 Tax=Penicillium ucsense TaxID=2839758 RepID=A0A8J8W437_9EURO|nr:Uncharacterized protein PECM_003857 [Penicillium ucsense]KAF7734923.1 Uncharacterized protein PECH_007376 [Penicillium ucsense]